jgi:hypothetical protein
MHALNKRYRRELFTAMSAYIVVMLCIWPFVRHVDSPIGRLFIALSPVVPFAFAMRAMIRHVRDSDEFQRRLHLEALAIAVAIVSFVCMTAGFLVAAKVIRLDGSVLLWIFPALCLMFGILRGLAARRYERE